MDDPQRLIEDLPQLASDLQRSGGLPPSGYDVEAGLARFQTAQAAPATASPGGAAASSGVGLKALALAAFVGVGALVALQLGGGEEPDAAPAAPVVAANDEPVPPPGDRASVETTVAEVETPAPMPPKETPEEASVEPSVRPSSAARAPRTRKPEPAPEAEAGSTPGNDAIAREIAATREMKKLARTDPAACLKLAAEARNEFGDGMLGLERDAYQIVALFGVGDREKATDRAQAYLKAHPNGPQSGRIRTLLGE